MMKWVFCVLILAAIVFAVCTQDVASVSEAALQT